MDSSPQPHKAAPRASRTKRLVAIAVIAAVLLFVGLTGRQWLYQKADPSNFDPTPAEGPDINAPFITSQQKVVEMMVEVADLSPDDLVYDLGCGDGRIVIAAVRQSGCHGVGIDIDPERIKDSGENAKEHGVADRIDFREQDVFTVDLSPADVAMIYLTGWMIEKLEPQFEQMKPGARIVTHDFWIEQVRPDRVVHVDVEDGQHSVFYYILPLKRDASMVRGTPPQPKDAVLFNGDAEKEQIKP